MVDISATLAAVSSALSIIDAIANQLKRLWKKEPEPGEEIRHSVLAKREGDQILFQRDGKTIETITADELAMLDETSQDLIRVYEESMRNKFKIWKKVYPQRDASTDPIHSAKVEQQLTELAKGFCADLGRILQYLESIGKHLEDHYSDVRFVCREIESR